MLVFRITSSQHIQDLSGRGAFLHGGRWNSLGVHVLYTAQSPSLAALEVLANICGSKDIPPELAIVKIDIPDGASTKILQAGELPPGWSATNPPEFLAEIGDACIARKESLVLQVPSAVVGMESNFLINPAHSEFSKISIVEVISFQFDPRLFK